MDTLINMKIIPVRLLLATVFSIVASAVHGQVPALYKTMQPDSIQLLKLREQVLHKYLKDSANITGENKKYIVALFAERRKYVDELFDHKQLFVNKEVGDYLSALTNQIIENNPELKNLGTRFIFSRVFIPNAFSIGEGTIIFNMGLFAKLANESEAIFVLCHELAHLYLDHGNKAIIKYVNTIYSEDFQQELKDIKRSQYEKNKQLDKLEKNISFTYSRHSRQHESEADSIGLMFMARTGYDTRAAVDCLNLLDSIDKEKYNPEKDLARVFNFSAYPFQQKWIEKEDAFFGGITDKKLNKKEEDSLKTHPDCKLRAERVGRQIAIADNNSKKLFKVNETLFNDLKKRFQYEILDCSFRNNQVSRCLFYSMELLNRSPGDPFAIDMIGACFDKMFEKQKTHTLNQVIDLPSPYYDTNYNNLLEFLQKIRIKDMAAIGYYFMQQYQPALNNTEEFATLYKKCKHNFDDSQ